MEQRPIPIGIENFKEMITKDYYYVDKTLFMKELLDRNVKVSLFTRPRRFGKTLNMSMLKYFFEIPVDGPSNRELFRDFKISECGEKYLKHQERYPVISMTLKAAKQPTYQLAYAQILRELAGEFERHSYVLEGVGLSDLDKKLFRDFMNQRAGAADAATALQFLSKCLKRYHNQNAVILLDEYDVPLENAYRKGFYDPMIDFIRSLFESALKTNDYLDFAVITGCLRIGRESVFTGFNNLLVISILNQDYGEYFGFVESEVEEMLVHYEREARMDTMKRWYDGYRFGDAEVYNPWSVINFINRLRPDRNAIPVAEWANTSSNSIVRDLVYRADSTVKRELQALIDGETIEKNIHEDITYTDIYDSEDNLWNVLLFTGYLTVVSEQQIGDERYAKLRIPNTEIRTIYNHQISNWFRDEIKVRDLSVLYDAMLTGRTDIFEAELGRLLRETISYMDSGEAFCHGFVLGVLTNLQGYGKKSNREAGAGRFDILIYPDDITAAPVILELKAAKKFKELESAAERGLNQILEKGYADEFEENGYGRVLCYGLGFYRKQVRIVFKEVEFENRQYNCNSSDNP